MPNIATVLKEEILRLARKEVRKQTQTLKKTSAQYRKDIAEMKRRLADLQHKIGPLQKQVLKGVSAGAAEPKPMGALHRQGPALPAAAAGPLGGGLRQTRRRDGPDHL